MKPILIIVSLLALAGTILPALLFLGGAMQLSQVKTWMLVATITWFVTAPLWMGRKAS